MRSQSIFSLALVAFVTTSYAAPVSTELVERGFIKWNADDISSLLVAAEANHNSQKRDTDESDPTTLLAAAEASHGNQARDENSTTLLAAAEASHGNQARDTVLRQK